MKLYRVMMLSVILIFALALTGFAGVKAQSPVKVTWWTETSPKIEDINKYFVDPFNKAHPNIQLEIVPQEKLDDSLRTAIQAGSAPDILQTAGGSFIAEFVPAGVVKPMDDYAKKFGWSDKLLPWAYQAGFLEDKLYSLPLTYESMIMMYNKTLFDKNGWKMPTTRAELEALAKQIQDKGLHVYSYGYVGWEPTNEHLVGVYLNNAAGPDNVYKALTGQKKWTDPEFVTAINMLKADMVDKGWFSGKLENYYTYDWNAFFGELSSGKSAMMIIGTWGFRGASDFFTKETGNEWDWAPIPPYSDVAGKYNYELAIGSTLSINGHSPNPDAAAEVLNYLLTDVKGVLQLSATSNYGEWVIPVSFTDADYPAGTDPRIIRFHKDFAAVTGEGRYGYTTWTFWPADADTQLWKDIEQVWAGDMKAEDYLAAQQAAWDKARSDKKTLPIPKR